MGRLDRRRWSVREWDSQTGQGGVLESVGQPDRNVIQAEVFIVAVVIASLLVHSLSTGLITSVSYASACVWR